MQRAARSDRTSDSLPVLRRLVATAAFAPSIALVELHRRRGEVRRRHCLLALAREAGMPDWGALRAVLERDPSSLTLDARALSPPGTYPNHWFSTFDEAIAFQRAHGGRVRRHGAQAVVIPQPETPRPEASSDPATDPVHHDR
ncbi:MAG: hypothetical protein AB7P21_22575 [Lautropia sp.]